MTVPAGTDEVARVVALWRYPVKSMGAEALTDVEVGWRGLAGDRRWAFLHPERAHLSFPWLTIRELPQMWRYQPAFSEPERPDASSVVVATPDGDRFDVTDPRLADELGEGVRVFRNERGNFDEMPVNLVSTQTLAWLGGEVGEDLDARRFRPNLLVEAAGDEPFQEESWVGRVLQIGGCRVRLDLRDNRCVMVNVDPVTSERNPAVLRTLARRRDACLAVYGSVVQPGRVAVGDPVALVP